MLEKNIEVMYQPKYEYMFYGIKRCLICGLPFAPGEDSAHIRQHSSFISAKENNERLLTYEEGKKLRKINKELLKTIKETDKNDILQVQYKDFYLDNLIDISFSYSFLFWNFNEVNHPPYDEYVKLLWNTEGFQEKIIEELGIEFFNKNFKYYEGEHSLGCDGKNIQEDFVFIRKKRASSTLLAQ